MRRLAALLVVFSLASCKEKNKDSKQVAALARELQAFGQQGDIPASAAHRDWLLDHIAWDELLAVLVIDAMHMLEAERREDAIPAFQRDLDQPSDNTIKKRRRSIMILSVALGNSPCKVVAPGSEDAEWARARLSTAPPTDGLSPASIEFVQKMQAKLSALGRLYHIDCARKQVHVLVAVTKSGLLLPVIRPLDRPEQNPADAAVP